jgi:lysophospholipase L1-like esterase
VSAVKDADMPVILVFGDSNVWGATPETGERMGKAVRWPGVMAQALGPGYEVIEEGLRGRTTAFDDPEEAGRNGLAYLSPCLRSHAPLDLVIVSLGCNDCKTRFAATPETIAANAARLVDSALASGCGPDDAPPAMILISPPPMAKLTGYAEMFDGGAAKALRLPALYRALAESRGIGFVESGAFILCSDDDGIHYAPDQHALLGAAMAEAVRMMLT